MALYTAFTEMFAIGHPIALAPMGGSAPGALAAAVCAGPGGQALTARHAAATARQSVGGTR